MFNEEALSKLIEAVEKNDKNIWNNYNKELREVKNSYADLSGININKYSSKNRVDLRKCDFVKVNFTGADLSRSRLQGANLDQAILKNCNLWDICMDEFTIFNNVEWGKRENILKIKIDKINAAQIKNFYNKIGNYELADSFYIKQISEINKEKNKCTQFFFFLWKISSNYGISILRWIVTMTIIISFFSIITYCFFGKQFIILGEQRPFNNLFEAFYFTFVTFTTLGFGDISPVNCMASRILVIIEVISGYIMLGGLITIFSNKLIRR